MSCVFLGFARLAGESRRDLPPITWVLPPGLSARALGGVFELDWISRWTQQFRHWSLNIFITRNCVCSPPFYWQNIEYSFIHMCMFMTLNTKFAMLAWHGTKNRKYSYPNFMLVFHLYMAISGLLWKFSPLGCIS